MQGAFVIFVAMKNVKILTLLFFTTSKIMAQNIVPNGSFEQYDTCPNNTAQIYFASSWFQPNKSWGNIINSSTTDYFNNCSQPNSVGVPKNAFGFQQAKTGTAYAGIITCCGSDEDTVGYREYLEIKLIQPLEVNGKYCVEFYCSLADSASTMATNKIGIYFSTDSILDSSGYQNLTVNPQIENVIFLDDTSKWYLTGGIYLASGNEQFITIGNFRNNNNTDTIRVKEYPDWLKQSYYYIDDVSVTLCTDTCKPPVAKFNYNTYALSASFNNLTDTTATNWQWYFGDGKTDTSQNPVHIYDSAGTYTVIFVACNQTGCCNEMCCDTMVGQVSVSVGVDELQNEVKRLLVYPNPASGKVTITFNYSASNDNTLVVTDITGRKVKEYFFIKNNFIIQNGELENGFYILSLYNNIGDFIAFEKLFIGR